MIKTGSDFSGVGAFDQALSRLGIVQDKMFACDMDKYARQTYVLNYGEPKYYPENVYDREIPSDSLDIYMTSPPCQSFSLAGKRQGENSDKGVLFYNSHEFIQKNNPRYFIFENVKGLLSDDGGKTFQRWIDYLGGKTVNGNPVIFPHENSVPYHVYYQVMNAKHYGVPQNRERIFIIGIRDDADNEFSFPKPFHLVKRLKDVLESEVDEKYFLSNKMIEGLIKSGDKSFINQDTQASKVFSEDGESPNICAGTHGYANGYVETKIPQVICFGRSETEKARRKEVFAKTGKDSGSFKDKELIVKNQDYYDTLLANPNPQKEGLIMIPANNSKGYDIAEEEEEEDLINFSNPNSETRRGRVGHGVAQTLDTACNQGVLTSKKQNEKGNTIEVLQLLQQEIGEKEIRSWRLRILEELRKENILQQELCKSRIEKQGEKTSIGNHNKIQSFHSSKSITRIIVRSMQGKVWNGCTPQRRKSIKQLIRKLNESVSWLSYENSSPEANMQIRELQYESEGIRLLREALSKIQEIWESIYVQGKSTQSNSRIRRLTPTEAFRLMDFNPEFIWDVSDSQAYKQAGNSICVGVLSLIISKLNLQ